MLYKNQAKLHAAQISTIMVLVDAPQLRAFASDGGLHRGRAKRHKGWRRANDWHKDEDAALETHQYLWAPSYRVPASQTLDHTAAGEKQSFQYFSAPPWFNQKPSNTLERCKNRTTTNYDDPAQTMPNRPFPETVV